MICRSPCETYIKYLLVHPTKYGDQEVIDLLRLKQLDFLGPSYLQRLRMDLRPPRPFRPYDKLHKPSTRFLNEHRLLYLFRPDAPTQRALKLLEDPPMKEIIETALRFDDPDGLIAYRVESFGRECCDRTIQRYRFFFFNTRLVDTAQLDAVLRFRTDFVDPNADDYEEQFRRAAQKTAHRDPRRMQYASKNVASLLNQMRLGFMPSQFQIQNLMEATRIATVAQANISASLGGPHGANDTVGYITAAKMLTEMLQETGNADAELSKDLQKLALQTEAMPAPYIAELSDGNHTVDLMPLTAGKEEIDV